VLNKWATFGAKNIHAFLRYSDLRVGIFYFASPCMCLYLCTCCYGCQVLKVDHNNLVEIPSLLGRLERLTSFSCASQRPRVRLLPGSVTRLRQLQVSSNAFFSRAMLCISAAYAVVRCLSVCLSLRHVRGLCQIFFTIGQPTPF